MMKKHDGADIDGFQISLRFAEDRNRDGGGGGAICGYVWIRASKSPIFLVSQSLPMQFNFPFLILAVKNQ